MADEKKTPEEEKAENKPTEEQTKTPKADEKPPEEKQNDAKPTPRQTSSTKRTPVVDKKDSKAKKP